MPFDEESFLSSFWFVRLSCSGLKKLELTEEICKGFFTPRGWHGWWRAMRCGGDGGREWEPSARLCNGNESKFSSVSIFPFLWSQITLFPSDSLKIKCYPLILILLLRLDLFTSVATPKWNYDLARCGWTHRGLQRSVWKTVHHVVLHSTLFYFFCSPWRIQKENIQHSWCFWTRHVLKCKGNKRLCFHIGVKKRPKLMRVETWTEK